MSISEGLNKLIIGIDGMKLEKQLKTDLIKLIKENFGNTLSNL